MLGEHPVGAPLGVACFAVVLAIAATMQFRFGLAVLSAADALGMIALAAHSTVERDEV